MTSHALGRICALAHALCQTQGNQNAASANWEGASRLWQSSRQTVCAPNVRQESAQGEVVGCTCTVKNAQHSGALFSCVLCMTVILHMRID